jgi:23S rRNA (adenine2503-C2)-methyltransferase
MQVHEVFDAMTHPNAQATAQVNRQAQDAMRSLPALRTQLAALGANPKHTSTWLRAWLHGRLDATLAPHWGAHELPARMRQALPALHAAMAEVARVHSAHASGESAARLLVALSDGQSIEAVLLPKLNLCVSTQLGCAVGCVFCKTGEGGLQRQLSSVEIVAQVALARQRREVRKVVFMGMGEPAHNLHAVLEAVDVLALEGGIGHKNLVISTVGDLRLLDALQTRASQPGAIKPALAVSLHTASDGQRATLLPRAPPVALRTLVERSDAYAVRTGHPVQYQWTLMAGVNDSAQALDDAAVLLQGRFGILNLIAYNTIEGQAFTRPSTEHAAWLVARLAQRGIKASVRDSAAQTVDGGCGQLRARTLASVPVMFRRLPPPSTPTCAS